MVALHINLVGKGEEFWKDIEAKNLQVPSGVKKGLSIRIACLEAGMQSGKPSVVIATEQEDGSFVLAESSLALFLTAADAFKARFGDPRVHVAVSEVPS